MFWELFLLPFMMNLKHLVYSSIFVGSQESGFHAVNCKFWHTPSCKLHYFTLCLLKTGQYIETFNLNNSSQELLYIQYVKLLRLY